MPDADWQSSGNRSDGKDGLPHVLQLVETRLGGSVSVPRTPTGRCGWMPVAVAGQAAWEASLGIPKVHMQPRPLHDPINNIKMVLVDSDEMSETLSSFPSISEKEFMQGCEVLLKLFQAKRTLQTSWSAVKLETFSSSPMLTVEKAVDLQDLSIVVHQADELGDHSDEVTESDEEALVITHNTEAQPALVRYNLTLSPTYQVPVLYFDLVNGPSKTRPSIEEVYRVIVPETFQPQLKTTGVIGGISMTNHPVTDMPTFFIHPCNTPSALEAVSPDKSPTPSQYLQLWFGLIGSSVGLSIPSVFVQ